MLGTVLNWLSGGIVTSLANAYFKHLETKANSTNEKERIKAEVEIARLAEKSETNRTAMGYSMFWAVFALFAIPPGIWQAKVIVWDIVLGWGVTDPIRGQAALWAEMVVQYMFPSGAAVGSAAAISAALLARGKR